MRSSYKAGEFFLKTVIEQRRAGGGAAAAEAPAARSQSSRDSEVDGVVVTASPAAL